MKYYYGLGWMLSFMLSLLHAQENTPQKGVFYISFGYQRDWYSRSDLRLHSKENNYDFTLYNLKAKDKPDFNKIPESCKNFEVFSIPQYCYRMGYYFAKRSNWGIELNFDHAKYVMVDNQQAHIKGQIFGVQYDKDTLVHPLFLRFEHTNGANFLLFNVLRKFSWYTYKKLKVSGVVKAGAGVVIPKTDVTLFNNRLDNRFHVAGTIVGIEPTVRIDIGRFFYLEPSIKGVFANYSNVLVMGDGKAKHHFFAFEAVATLGFQVPL